MARQRTPRSGLAAQAERMESELSAIRRSLRKPLEAEVAHGELTVPQIAVMRLVVRNAGVSIKDLSREVSLAHSTVSGIIDRLQKRGMVERRADPADARIARVYPAAAVTEFVRKQIPTLVRGPLVDALARVQQAERDRIEEALRRLRKLLESE